jgi:diguanylate cyclase (GGDEF)-like protein
MARGLAAKIDGLADGEAAARLAASRDPVTGAVNRRGFDARLGQTVAEARAEGARLCLLAVDLDRFKEVNDTHGHAAGDRVLAVVAARLAAQVRDTDWVARLGGDEFAVVLGDVDDRETAFGIAERIIHAVEQPIAGDADRVLSVGASVGVAFFPDDAVDPAGLRQAADDALYAAKRAGRGRWYAAVAGSAWRGAAVRA